jgi:hypothetical protein
MKLLTRIRCDSGQAFVFVAFMLMVLVGMAALVIDGGSWYRADRHAQTAADAAALAGAQELPDRGDAEDLANEYWSKNPDDSTSDDALNFPDPAEPEYQITTKVTRKAQGVFAKVLGIDSVAVGAEAQATVQAPLELKNVAPIAVKNTDACIVSDPDCFGPDHKVLLSFDESRISSSNMGLVDLRCQSSSSPVDCGGGPGAKTLEEWIDNGYDDALPTNKWYDVKPGETVGPIRDALQRAVDDEKVLFFPVFDEATSDSFHVIGWAAFVIERVVEWSPDNKGCSPNCKVLEGHFETFIATDLAAGGTISDPDLDFGVHVITLTR